MEQLIVGSRAFFNAWKTDGIRYVRIARNAWRGHASTIGWKSGMPANRKPTLPEWW